MRVQFYIAQYVYVAGRQRIIRGEKEILKALNGTSN